MSTDAARSIIKHGLAGTPGMANPATRLLADIRQAAPAIIARSAEIETARRLPPDLVDALRSIGVFHKFVPRSHDLQRINLRAIRSPARFRECHWNSPRRGSRRCSMTPWGL